MALLLLAASILLLATLLAATAWCATRYRSRLKLSRRAIDDLRIGYRFRIRRALEHERRRTSQPGAPPPPLPPPPRVPGVPIDRRETLRPPPLPGSGWEDDGDETEHGIHDKKTRLILRKPRE